jgi:DNA-binding NarL/FixJ family response regulator
MSQIPLIVMERSGNWAAALRLWLEPLDARLYETRMIDECWQRLVEQPTALAALELTADNVRPLLALLRLRRELPEARAIVMAERTLAAYGELVREAGAIHFVVSPRSLGDVAELVRRRIDHLAASAPLGVSDLDDPREKILADLPWSDVI